MPLFRCRARRLLNSNSIHLPQELEEPAQRRSILAGDSWIRSSRRRRGYNLRSLILSQRLLRRASIGRAADLALLPTALVRRGPGAMETGHSFNGQCRTGKTSVPTAPS